MDACCQQGINGVPAGLKYVEMQAEPEKGESNGMEQYGNRGHDGMEDALGGAFLPKILPKGGVGREVLPDLYAFTGRIVNLCFVGHPESGDGWVMVDAGLPGSASVLIREAERRFGAAGPRAIVLTHGHFDHVGAAAELARIWDVPVYAHPAEQPYLTGQTGYPEPDGSVEGGLIARLSPLFPSGPADLGGRVRPLPEDGSIPHLPGWRWIHTPGHTPGHISLFREGDRALIAGDAFVTVRQDSLMSVMTRRKEVSGPPRYLTTDWDAARESVRKLESLRPAVAVAGHGLPMAGEELASGLAHLAKAFDRVAVPAYGRYVDRKP